MNQGFLRALVADRVFVAALVVLALAAALLPAAVARTEARFRKQPIALRRSLHDFDVRSLPSYEPRPDIQAVGSGPEWVGTEEMLLTVFAPRTPAAGRREVHPILFATYYSDPDDTVPHTPEVCYRQASYEIVSMGTTTLDLSGLADGPVVARTIDFRRESEIVTVVYVFHHNGRFFHDREALRLAMGWPGDRHTYFSKVEAVIHRPAGWSHEDAVEEARRFLQEAVPELVRSHYPTVEAVRGG